MAFTVYYRASAEQGCDFARCDRRTRDKLDAAAVHDRPVGSRLRTFSMLQAGVSLTPPISLPCPRPACRARRAPAPTRAVLHAPPNVYNQLKASISILLHTPLHTSPRSGPINPAKKSQMDQTDQWVLASNLTKASPSLRDAGACVSIRPPCPTAGLTLLRDATSPCPLPS